MAAESPFSNYTAYAVVYAILGLFFAFALLGIGILTVNLAMMSKRAEDRIGGRDPSDVGVLKSTNWPQAPEERAVLPAMEEEDEREFQEVSVLGIPLERRDIETAGTTPEIPKKAA
jgi:hypothetical protein